MASKHRTPSIRMVAERAGVSVATVSNVLNNKASVSADFAERVTRAVAELGYVMDIGASRLRSGRTALVGLVVPDLVNPMFASFVSTLEHAARIDGFDLVVVSARNDPAEEADRLSSIRSWRPAGLIVIPCDGGLKARLPDGHAIPTVVADRIPNEGRFDLVAVDNGAASAKIARHLVESGMRSCLVVGTSLSISNIAERWEGVVAAATGAMRVEVAEVGFNGGKEPLADLARRLEGSGRPDSLFALDHMTALNLYGLLAARGIDIPRDLAFASFDEMEWMRLVSPGITAVAQPVEAMAEASWALLTKRMRGETGEPITRRLECAVTFRGSTSRRSPPRESEAA